MESFEPGASVTHFIRRHTPFNAGIVALGVDTYLSMLLKHNFVHTDLHPGRPGRCRRWLTSGCRCPPALGQATV